jgi:hypothetical protein
MTPSVPSWKTVCCTASLKLIVQSDVAHTSLPPVSCGRAECVVLVHPSGNGGGSSERWDRHTGARRMGTILLSCARDGNDYRLGMRGWRRSLIDAAGSNIACFPHETLPPGTLEHLLIDQVLPRGVDPPRPAGATTRVVSQRPWAPSDSSVTRAPGKSTLTLPSSRAPGIRSLGDDGIVVRRAPGAGLRRSRLIPASGFSPVRSPNCSTTRRPAHRLRTTPKSAGSIGTAGASRSLPAPSLSRALYLLGVGPTVASPRFPSARRSWRSCERRSSSIWTTRSARAGSSKGSARFSTRPRQAVVVSERIGPDRRRPGGPARGYRRRSSRPAHSEGCAM